MSDMELNGLTEDAVEEVQGAQDGQSVDTEAASQTEDGRQPKAGKSSVPNLDELEDFRKWKSVMDKQINELRQSHSAAEKRAWEAEQRMHQLAMQNMDESQRKDYMIQMLQNQLQQLEQQRQLELYAMRKEQDILYVAQKMGLDANELKEALPQGADNHQMWDIATDMARKRAKLQQPAKAQKVENQVYTGTGSSAPAPNKWQKMYDEARREFDTDKMLNAMAGAGRDGVTLNEW